VAIFCLPGDHVIEDLKSMEAALRLKKNQLKRSNVGQSVAQQPAADKLLCRF
jgi:hypothetical protein